MKTAAVEAKSSRDDDSSVQRIGAHADPPLIALLVANGITLVLAVVQQWELGTVLLIYWCQSVTIGLFTFIRILGAKEPTGGEGSPVRRLFLAGFFAFHYGLFHFVYISFILGFAFFGLYGISDFLGVLFGAGVFFVNHLISYLWFRARETRSPDEVFIEPYYRIVPMHLTIILGGFATALLPGLGLDASVAMVVVFLLLKTGADLWAHQRQHDRAVGLAPGDAAG